ncbi:MAG: hypothetical protein KAS21_11450 [Candidatus Aminicenantes bacterium]|nr:hypothetical protein [Candidatus Aminicenantes bacterium]MCK5005700.1 hypothetical protein [Candidatus Aminicenantes bacterium]
MENEKSDKSDGNNGNGLGLRIGAQCFRFRAISVVPIILICFFVFNPDDMGRFNTLISISGFAIALFGGLIRMTSVGFSKPVTSGRENYLKAENLNISGLYSLIRNPLYVGNFFIYNGVIIAYSSIYALILLNIFFILNYYFIILSEENFLKKQFGKEYKEYLDAVPKVIPNFKNYKKNEGKFSLLKVILREKNTTFYWVLLYVVSLLLKQYKLNDATIDNFWFHAIPVIAMFALNIGLTIYKKYFTSEKVYT